MRLPRSHRLSRSSISPLDLIQGLEPRQMLAVSFSITDADGDLVTIKLTGNGNAVATLSGGATGFIEFLELTGTDAASALSISVKQQGGDGTVLLADMNDAALGKFSAPTTNIVDASFALTDVTSFSAGLVAVSSIELSAPVGKALSIATGDLSDGADFTLHGPVKSFKLKASSSGLSVAADSTIASIAATGSLGGAWSATNYGNITAKGILTALMNASLPDAKGYSFGAIKANSALDAGLSHPFQLTAGRIKSITMDSWGGGGILAAGIDTLKIKGDFSPTSVNLSEVPATPFSIKSGTIGGTANTQFILGAPVGTLKIGATGPDLEFSAFNNNVNVKSLSFTGTGTVNGEFQFASIDTLSAKGTLDGFWDFTGQNAKGQSVGSIKAPRLDGFETSEDTDGGIGSITTNGIDSCDIFADFFTTISVKKSGGGGGLVDSTDITATGADANGFSFKTVTVAGGVVDAWFVGAGNVDKFTTLFFDNADLFAGRLDPTSDSHPDFDSFADFSANGSINKFTITQKFNLADVGFNFSHVVAGTINTVSIASAIELSESETTGFGARSFGKVTLKDLAGKSLKVTVPAGVGDTNPFLPTASDFVFRVYA